MISKSKEEQKKYQNIITEKLRELLGEYEVDILTEYVWHMAGNVKTSSEFMCNELKDFLGDHTTVFVNWLMKLMNDIKKQKKIDSSTKNEKAIKSGSTRDRQLDELSRSNKSRDTNTRHSITHSKKTKDYVRDYDTNRRDLSACKRRSRSYLSRSSKNSYNNEKESFAKRVSRKRFRRGMSIRSSSSSADARKFHYDKNKIRTKKNDKGADIDRTKFKDKYRKVGRSTSRSFTPSRVIYVEKDNEKKERKNEMLLESEKNKSEPEERKLNDNTDECNSNEKKNKAILKPNPRFVGDKPVPYLQPAAPGVNNQEMQTYHMNYPYENMHGPLNYEKRINTVGNYYQGNYLMNEQRDVDNNMNNNIISNSSNNNSNNTYMSSNMSNNFFNPRYSNNYNMQQKNINFKMNMNKSTPPPNFLNTNRFPNNMNNSNNYIYQKSKMMNVNIPKAPNNDRINPPIYPKQINNMLNVRSQQNMSSNTIGSLSNNNNNFIDTKQIQQHLYGPNGNKQKIFNQGQVHPDIPAIRTQAPYITHPLNQNLSSHHNIQNVHLNNNSSNTHEKISFTNDSKNLELSQVQTQFVQGKDYNTPNMANTNMANTNTANTNTANTNTANPNAEGNQIVQSENAGDNANAIVKIPKKCHYLPNCQYGDKCRYIHPIENCRNWPFCAFGSECIYIHPNVPCKFGMYCANYYCNYSHDHVDTTNLPEIGTNGYFLNKKLINSNQKTVDGNANFDDKVAQISISMPKTPPEMRKDKNKTEYNENEYIENIIESEKADEKYDVNNEQQSQNDYRMEIIREQNQENGQEVHNLKQIREESFIFQNNDENTNYFAHDNLGNAVVDTKENEAVDYNCFDIVIDPENLKGKNVSTELNEGDPINGAGNN
ncbi:nuclear polyadenylated RNA-binding protein NAB2 [Plasmodium brasilianum]|uniref:Nuclear polyadenylated RNA-binding protein NAB2 n=1 Tax=Plasmodium brasilianum TaxID=5824 RepID=A0ACB9Y680_PLABR|nr:nuclear polyadenylated RNA-binding protein NAB2 [Plasmodium brasilianum]